MCSRKKIIYILVLLFWCLLCCGKDVFAGQYTAGKDVLAPAICIDNYDFNRAMDISCSDPGVPASFILHIRPFETLCDIARLVHEREGISIFLSARAKETGENFKIKRPLHEVKNYGSVLAKYFKSFGESRYEMIRIKHEHEFYLRMLDKDSRPCFPAKLVDLLNGFFTNTLTRADGSAMDVSFQTLETEDLKGLSSADIQEIKYKLGYGARPLREGKKSGYAMMPDPRARRRDRERMPRELYEMIIEKCTPDYKGVSKKTGLIRRAI